MGYIVFAYADKSMQKIAAGQLGRVTAGNHPGCTFHFPFLSETYSTDLGGVVSEIGVIEVRN